MCFPTFISSLFIKTLSKLPALCFLPAVRLLRKALCPFSGTAISCFVFSLNLSYLFLNCHQVRAFNPQLTPIAGIYSSTDTSVGIYSPLDTRCGHLFLNWHQVRASIPQLTPGAGIRTHKMYNCSNSCICWSVSTIQVAEGNKQKRRWQTKTNEVADGNISMHSAEYSENNVVKPPKF